MRSRIQFLAVAILVFWAGYVSSISFMEAWVKFLAPNVTLPIGLSIGRKVFHALNHVEWFLFGFSLVLILYLYRLKDGNISRLFSLIVIILGLQSFILLPSLDKSAEIIIQGHIPEKSQIHIYYVVLEILKVFFLIVLSYFIYNTNPQKMQSTHTEKRNVLLDAR